MSAPHGSELQPAAARRGSEGLMEHPGVHKLCAFVFVGRPFLPSSEASTGQSSHGCFSALHLCLSFPFLQGQSPALAVGTLQLSNPGQAVSATVLGWLLSDLASASFPL